ncbi:Oidioi.mRNA.OKI2018_I69.chr2.g5527.t1.cds [Oikopleura dioica]|uniref:Oidioi.mRNA.OKI2018_I69.chr2.g5527.t1.cds n=1 Tax=Oikopleura dioica TaxID=34765 RepID=A0ABN7T0B0_OIKDI|nr:Oidioi.mRNA.OKI2018_I69.chr2.g5527.t1.cds [Oikopleura dioica]
MLEYRQGTKEKLTDLLRDLVMSNAELAQSYKVIQAKEMAVKNSMSGFFELRNILDDSKMCVGQLITMENEFHSKTRRYHECRDAYHSCEYQVLEKSAKDHVARVLRIESQLNKGLQQVTNFIEKLYSSGDLPATEQAKRQSLMGHVSSSFSRMSVFQPANGQTQTVIPAIERKKSAEQETS